MEKFNIKKFLVFFIPMVIVGLILDLIFRTHIFSYIGMLIGAYMGAETKIKK